MPAAEGCFSFCVLSNMAAFVSGQGTRIVPLDALYQQPPPWRPTIKGVSCGSSDGRWLAIFEPFTPVLHVYSVPSLDRVALLTNSANIGAVSFPNSGERLFIASGKQISTWSTVTWSKTAEMDKYRSALMNPSGRTMWLSSFQTSGLYEADTAELLLPLPRGSYPLAISPDGTVLAYALDARQLRICNLQQLNLEFERLGLGSLEQ